MADRDTGGSYEYVYDPTTGTWKQTSVSGPSSSDSPDSNNPPEDGKDGSSVDSTQEAEKEFIEIEFNTLTGDITLTPSEKSIRIKVNDTIKVEGIGKYLSGLYFVASVKRTLGSDGYSHSFSLLKNGFGDSVKSSS